MRVAPCQSGRFVRFTVGWNTGIKVDFMSCCFTRMRIHSDCHQQARVWPDSLSVQKWKPFHQLSALPVTHAGDRHTRAIYTRCAVHLGALSASRLSHIKAGGIDCVPAIFDNYCLSLRFSFLFFSALTTPPSAVCLSLLHRSEVYFGGARCFLCIRLR